MGDPYDLRSAEPEDSVELTSLFNAVFRSNGSLVPARRDDHWRWKYVDNGMGSHSSVAVVQGDDGERRIVGHVGGLPFPTWCQGRVRSTNQSVDNMIDPSDRRGLKRIGVFARLVNHWIETYFGCDRDFIAWGFPSESNFRIGQKFSKYSLFRTVNALVHENPSRLVKDHSGLESRLVERFDEGADTLWDRCSEDIELGVVRNMRHLNWRYADHPIRRYRLIEVRETSTGLLRGIGVTRFGGMADDAVLLVDWLVPTDDDDAAHCLLCACAKHAAELDAGAVTAWFPEGIQWFRHFQLNGFIVQPSPHIFVGRSWDRSVRIKDIRRAFYATPGDMDFY